MHQFGQDPAFLATRAAVFGDPLVVAGQDGQILGNFQISENQFSRLPLKVLESFGGFDTRAWSLSSEFWTQAEWGHALALVTNLAKQHRVDGIRLSLVTEAEISAMNPSIIGKRSEQRVWGILGSRTADKWLASYSKKMRGQIKKALIDCQNFGLRLTDHVTSEQIRSLYFSRHQDWSRLQGSDYSIDCRFQLFLDLFRERLRCEGRLRECGYVDSDGNLVSWGMGFRSGEVVHFFQTAHNPRFNKIRPGAALFYSWIAGALDSGAQVVSFMGHQHYHHLWTDYYKSFQRVELPISLMGRLLIKSSVLSTDLRKKLRNENGIWAH